MNWQPISTAPKTGAVMTEDGYVTWDSRLVFGQPRGWVACDASGSRFYCVEEGPWEMGPKWWIELPELPKSV